MGDFNIGMLKHDKNKDNATFLDSICSKFLLPYIMAPSHHISQTTQKSHLTLEHKLAIYFPIVLTMKFLQAIQHQQLLIMLLNSSLLEKIVLKEIIKKLVNINWNEILEIENKNVDRSFDNFINTFNELLSFHAPIQRISNIEPWTTRGILTPINAKNRIYRKYC